MGSNIDVNYCHNDFIHLPGRYYIHDSNKWIEWEEWKEGTSGWKVWKN